MRGVSVGILALGLLDEEGEENESSPYTQAAHVFGVWRKVRMISDSQREDRLCE